MENLLHVSAYHVPTSLMQILLHVQINPKENLIYHILFTSLLLYYTSRLFVAQHGALVRYKLESNAHNGRRLDVRGWYKSLDVVLLQ
jgi:hypothetical protein